LIQIQDRDDVIVGALEIRKGTIALQLRQIAQKTSACTEDSLSLN
jgi:hypothetical protein